MYGTIRLEEAGVSALASFLRKEMDQRGWDPARLARKAKVPTTTLHNILHQRSPRPFPDTLRKLAAVLGCSPAYLTSLVGYSVEDLPTPDDRLVRLARAIEALPWLEAGVEKWLQLDSEEQEDILDQIERRLARRSQKGQKPRRTKPENDDTEGNDP